MSNDPTSDARLSDLNTRLDASHRGARLALTAAEHAERDALERLTASVYEDVARSDNARYQADAERRAAGPLGPVALPAAGEAGALVLRRTVMAVPAPKGHRVCGGDPEIAHRLQQLDEALASCASAARVILGNPATASEMAALILERATKARGGVR